jgi:carboxyl-terminal processing protease
VRPLSRELLTTTEERKKVLTRIDGIVRSKYFDPKFNGRDWPRMIAEHEPRIVGAPDAEAFEREMNDLLKGLGTSHTGFFNPKTRVPSRNSINATFRALPTELGNRWVFQDVQPGGPADRVGIKPGDILMSIDDREVLPPVSPDFRMHMASGVTLIHRNGTPKQFSLTVNTPRPKYSDCPYAEPKNVVSSILPDGIGYLKVAMFPGIIGIDFAHEIDVAVANLANCDRLILDLRGNPGGGIGGLRLMSYLTPDKRPVGYSPTRQRADRGYRREELPRLEGIPSAKWQLLPLGLRFIGRDHSIVVVTEGRGPKRFHKRVVVLVNEHTAGAGEMVAGFVRENGLGKIVGVKTAGRLLGGKGFKVGFDFILMIPVGAYLSWEGRRYEGNGIEPDVPSDWDAQDAVAGRDGQLERAIEVAAGS